MPRSLLPVETVLTILRDTPPRLRAIARGVTADGLRAPPADGGWSANEVLAHLRAGADVWGGCIVAMLDEDRPTLRAVNPRAWIEETDYAEQPFRRSLTAFTAQRAALLTVLDGLDESGWSRSATVTGAGRPLERTVHFYADWLARHERPHLRQIEAVVGELRV